MGNCHVVGPDEVMVVSGGCSNGRSVTIGGCAWACWGLTDVQKLSLNVMTLLPTCDSVETKEGVQVHVTGVAQVQVIAEDHLADKIDRGPSDEAAEPGLEQGRDFYLVKALEHFLGKSPNDIKESILQTLEGHLRSILGTLTVEEIYRDRERFAKLVCEVAKEDVREMGIEILSFSIKDVTDTEGYLDSLGVTQRENVQRDADIGAAEAVKDAVIVEKTQEKAWKQAQYAADTAIANSKRDFNLKEHEYAQEVNLAQAEANLSYQLQAAKTKQSIRKEEMEVEVVVRRRQIEVEEQEVIRKEKDLIANVHRPAEASRFEMETLAEADKTLQIATAEAEAEAIKALGAAEATKIQAIGEAEADAMQARAEAYQQYGSAAVMSLVLDALPEYAREIAAPLKNVKEVVVLSGGQDSVTGDITKLLSELPPAVQALTGADLTSAIQSLARGAGGANV